MPRAVPLLLLMPAVAFAQTPEVVAKVDAKLDAERATQRNEDVEILRRLLNKAAGLPDKASVRVPRPLDPHESPRNDPFSDNQLPRASSPVGPFDGVYLPGAGVVFTLHVPAGAPLTIHADRIGLNSACNTCHQPQPHFTHASLSVSATNCTACHNESVKPVQPLSDWDRVKQDVRGEKAKPTDKPKGEKAKAAMCEPGSVQTLIAGVLAANGKNVRHLPEKEGITVVVTFDEVTDKAETTVFPADTIGFTGDELKALTLGDLHLKGGKYKEAVAAYQDALRRIGTSTVWKINGRGQWTPRELEQRAVEFQKAVQVGLTNLAKAAAVADQPELAKRALDQAAVFEVVETNLTTTTKPTAPAKLIVSVSKADIDSANDATAFRKTVKAERLNWTK